MSIDNDQNLGGTHLSADVGPAPHESSHSENDEAWCVLNSLAEHIVVLDRHGTIIAANDAWRRFAVENSDDPVAVAATTLVGANYLNACLPANGSGEDEYAARAYVGIKQVLDGETDKFVLEYPCHSPIKDRWFSMSCTPLCGGQGRAVVTHVEISPQKLAEDKLRNSEENYRNLFENNPVPMWVYEIATTCILEVNDAAARTYGYARDEFLKMTIHDLVPANDELEPFSGIREEADGHDSGRIAFHRKADGSIIVVETTAHDLVFHARRSRIVMANDVTERVLAEARLRTSEARYRLLFEDNPWPMITYDFESMKFLDVNEATCLSYGYTRDEFLKMKLTDIGSPADVGAIMARVKDNGERRTVFGSWKHRRKDGSEFWVETASHRLEIEGENSRIVLINDVTEKRRAEDELREAEQRFRATFERAAIGIAHIAPDGRWLIANERLCEITGFTKEELAERTYYDIIHPDEHEHGRDLMRLLRDGKIPEYSSERRYVRKDGEIIWIHKTVSLVRDDDGAPKYVISVIEDITQRKLAEEALRDSEAKLRLFVEFSPAAVAMFDREMKYLAASRSWLDMLSLDDDAIGKRHYDLITDLSDECREYHRRALAGAIEKHDEVEYVLPDGTAGWFRWEAHPWFTTNDEIGGIMMLSEDISDRKRAAEELRRSEEKLRQSQKMEAVGRLAGGIAHDFNNMLTVIKGYSEMGLRSLSPNDGVRAFIEAIRQAGDRSSMLTHQLLAFSRTQIIQPEVLSINEAILETLKMLKFILGEDIGIELDLAPDAGSIEADRGNLSQVVMNLLVNARDAMPNGGTVSIATERVGPDAAAADLHESFDNAVGYVRLTVSDNGVGMEDSIMAMIFEPFFTTKEAGKGTGLGLSTVYGIVKQSGGHISVASEIGRGTTFSIHLPLISPPEPPDCNGDEPSDVPLGTATILVVEDEELVRNLTRSALETFGYRVLEAGNGAEALETLRRADVSVDLLMTDVVMPEMSGIELFETLSKGPLKRPRFMFMSGYTDDERLRDARFRGGENFIQKPFKMDDLVGKIERILKEPAE